MGVLSRTHSKAAVGIFDPASAGRTYNMLQGIQPGGMGVPPTRGTQQYLAAYSEMPWLNAVTDRIATAVARTEWQLFVARRQGAGRRQAVLTQRVKQVQRCNDRKLRVKLLKEMQADGELDQVMEHPFLDLLSRANSFQTGYGMRRITQLHLDLAGDAFWLKERDALKTVVGVWPVPPHWIQSTPTPAFPYFRVMFRAWRAIIPDTEFVWFSNDDPLNPYGRGTASARALGDELETDEYAAKFSKMFFFNNARPDLIVYPKNGASLKEGEAQRLEEDWQAKNAGFWRAFRAHFLSREVEVKELGQQANMRAMQMVPLRQFQRDTVMQVHGMPPELLGVLEHSNRSTISAAAYLMGRYLVEPRLELLRSVKQERLLPEYDERLMLEYASPVDEDAEAQAKAVEEAPHTLSVNEHRRRQGLPPHEDKAFGALHAVPGTITLKTVENILEPPKPPPGLLQPPGAPPPPGMPQAVGDGEDALQGRQRGARGLLAHGAAEMRLLADAGEAAADAGDLDLAAGMRKAFAYSLDELPHASAAAARLEPALARAWRQACLDHAETVDLPLLEAACTAGNDAEIAAQLRTLALGKAQQAALVPHIVTAYLRGANIGADALARHGVAVWRGLDTSAVAKQRMHVDFASVNPRATAWAQRHAADLMDAPAEVRERVRELVVRANEQGIPPADLARLLRQTIGLQARQAAAVEAFYARLVAEGISAAARAMRVARYARAQLGLRAMTIARTELLGALNGGQQALWEEAVAQGAIERDAFVKQWIATGDDITCQAVCEPVADETTEVDETFSNGFMAPPAHPACRCTIGLVPREEAELA